MVKKAFLISAIKAARSERYKERPIFRRLLMEQPIAFWSEIATCGNSFNNRVISTSGRLYTLEGKNVRTDAVSGFFRISDKCPNISPGSKIAIFSHNSKGIVFKFFDCPMPRPRRVSRPMFLILERYTSHLPVTRKEISFASEFS